MVSMTPEEAKQAEAVAESLAKIRKFSKFADMVAIKVADLKNVVEIVDSQAQKIEAMQKQLNACSLLMDAARTEIERLTEVSKGDDRKYTEDELRSAFEDHENRDPVFDKEVERNEHGEYKDRMVEVAWFNFMRCARFLRAIKEQGK